MNLQNKNRKKFDNCIKQMVYAVLVGIIGIMFSVSQVDYSFGMSNKLLLQHYQNKQYYTLLNKLKFEYYQEYNQVELYLLYKTLIHTKDYSRAKKTLHQLETRIESPFEQVIHFEKINQFIRRNEKDKFLREISVAPEKYVTPFLEKQIEQILVKHYSDVKNSRLLKNSFESLFPLLDSFQNNPQLLKIYLNNIKKKRQSYSYILLKIWENSDVNELGNNKKYATIVKTDIVKYQGIITNHFKKQLKLKNYTYIIKEAPAYLSLLNKYNTESHEDIRQVYFRAMKKKRQFTSLINQLKSKGGRKLLNMTMRDSISMQLRLWLKKRNPQKALLCLKKLKLLDSENKLNNEYLALGDYHYLKNEYKSSLEYYNKINQADIPKDQISRIKWKLFRIYLKQKNGKELINIADWAERFSFESEEIAARFCYWGYKNKLYQTGSIKKCYDNYPLTYYGLHSDNIGKVKARLKTDDSDFVIRNMANKDITQKEERFKRFIEVLYSVGEEEIADLIVKDYFHENNDISILVEIAEVLSSAKRFHLIQSIALAHYQELLQNSENNKQQLLPYFYPNAYSQEVKKYSEKTRVPEILVFSVMREESTFRPEVESIAGAIGLMQLMPKTAGYIGKTIGLKVKQSNLTEPDLNLKLGTAYLKRLLKRYKGNLFYTLAAYNGGPTNVRRWVRNVKTNDIDYFVEAIPYTETQNYVRRVMRSFYIYQKIYEQ